MQKHRYKSSFLITLFFYIVFIGTYIYFIKHNHFVKQTIPKTKVVKLSLDAFVPPPLSLPPEPDIPDLIEKPVLQEVPPPVPLPQPIITKPKIKPKPLKHKKRKHKKVTKPVTKTIIKNKSDSKAVPLQPHIPIYSQADKERFLSRIRAKINQAKSYPRIAKKRHIEGIINVSFTITKNGNIANLSVNGPKVFHTSAKKAVLNAFPIDTTNAPVSLPLDIKLKLHYQIH